MVPRTGVERGGMEGWAFSPPFSWGHGVGEMGEGDQWIFFLFLSSLLFCFGSRFARLLRILPMELYEESLSSSDDIHLIF